LCTVRYELGFISQKAVFFNYNVVHLYTMEDDSVRGWFKSNLKNFLSEEIMTSLVLRGN
jgi:hypothetical protein